MNTKDSTIENTIDIQQTSCNNDSTTNNIYNNSTNDIYRTIKSLN